jgi:iron complex transport system ATP-binding protein
LTEHRAPPLLVAKRLTIGVGRGKALRALASGIDVEATAGRFVCLLGPNGAGKSTLLKTLAGLQRPMTGDVSLAGTSLTEFTVERLAKRRAWCGPLRQTPPGMTVAELVALGRHPHTDRFARLRPEDHDAIRRAFDAVRLSAFADRALATLSDGERQKAQVARLLAQTAELLLLDEPTAFLDAKRRVELLSLLREVARQTPCAVVAATHEIDLARCHADELWVLPIGGPLVRLAPTELTATEILEKYFA